MICVPLLTLYERSSALAVDLLPSTLPEKKHVAYSILTIPPIHPFQQWHPSL